MLGTQRFILFSIPIVIAITSYVGTSTSHITSERKTVTTSGSALTVVSDAEVLHGSQFEARKRRFSIGKFNVTIKQNWRNHIVHNGCFKDCSYQFMNVFLA